MKVTTKDIAGSLEQFNDEEKAFMQKNAKMVCDIINKALEGVYSSEVVETKFTELRSELEKSVKDNATLVTKNQELEESVSKIAKLLEKAKRNGIDITGQCKFFDKYDEMMQSKKFEDFCNGLTKASGWFGGFSTKEIANISSVTDNYDGNVLLSRQSNVFVNPFAGPKASVRDVIRSIEADPEHPTFTYLRVKSFDRNARYETENGRLSQSNLEFEEVSTGIKRVGSFFDISKNLLLARLQLRGFLIANIPGIITQAENASILFGDGMKNHLLGITNIAGVGSIEDQITGAIESVKAGDVKSVEKYADGKSCLVEFKTPISKALSSMMITFKSAAVNTSLLTAHPIIKINDRQVIVEGAAYSGVETGLASMTAEINHASFKSVDTPNSGDVIAAVLACLSFAQYTPNAIMLNPLTLFAIETEKDTMGRKLDIVQNVNGVKMISNLPVIEVTDMPVGMYLAGDFLNGANLYDYTNLEMQWVEDAETILYNMIRLVFQEQLALVVYMPWAFAYGSIDALRAAITKETPTVETPPQS